ncbi:MAG: small multi-drug export protein [Desulfurococcaceae archaeon]
MFKLILLAFISMIPVLEARAAFIYAYINRFEDSIAFIVIFLSSSLPSFLIIYGLDSLEKYIVGKNSFLNKVYRSIINRIRKKSQKITRFKIIYIGLTIFVAVPIPGSGVWTGSILSHILGLDRKLSIISIVIGNFLSCLILYITVYVLASVVV